MAFRSICSPKQMRRGLSGHEMPVLVQTLPSRDPSPTSPPSHWIGNPPTAFINPWSSFQKLGLMGALHTRFGPDRNFVSVPESRDHLVKVRTPDWGRTQPGWETGLKTTWLGHSGFLVEMPCINQDEPGEKRGLTILFDAVFSERTSPLTFLGPKRYTPTPCKLSELPEVDLIVASHNHYDHLDLATVRHVCHAKSGHNVQIFAPLNNKPWFLSSGLGLRDQDVHDCDWYQERQVSIQRVGNIKLTCTPAQHTSGRTPFDAAKTLWSSWVVEDIASNKRLFFAGDTAYKATHSESPCPEFAKIGTIFGSFDLALLPIGLYSPREALGSLHTDPEGSLEIHKAIKSKKSLGCHWGTVRGSLSQYYEDVREPPRRWQECCEAEAKWGSECGLCDVGETVIV